MAKVITTTSSKHKKTKTPAISEKGLGIYRKTLLMLLSIVIFYPSYLKGLFFENEQLPAEVYILAIFLAFWVYKALKKDNRFLETAVDYAAFGLCGLYFITVFWAVGAHQAISEWLQYCMYFAVFFMLSELLTTLKARITVLSVIIASALGVCILGFDAIAGERIIKPLNSLLSSNGNPVFFGLFVDGRIYSTLQYPNALASYLMAVFFIIIGITVITEKPWIKVFLSSINSIILVTFLFTLSRGVLLLFPIALVLFAAVIPKGFRVESVIYAFASFTAVAVESFKLSGYISNPAGNENKIWLCLALGMLISSVLTFVLLYVIHWLNSLSWKVYTGFLVSIIIIGLAAGLIALNTPAPLALEHSSTVKGKEAFNKQSLGLKGGVGYKLSFTVNASSSEANNEAYQIRITNKNERDILFERETPVLNYEGKATNGIEIKEIRFKVPADSQVVNIYFANPYEKARPVFDNATIFESDTGKLVENLTLKYKYIPNSISSRFEDVGASKSAIERGIFYKNGLSMFRDYWLLGAGGGAWGLLYYMYQPYLYWSRQAHNYFLQVSIGTGIFGLLCLLSLIASIVLLYSSKFINKSDVAVSDRILQSALLTGILMMFGHSVIDFDLSLSAVFLMLWQLIAVFTSYFKSHSEEIITSHKTNNKSSILINIQNMVRVKRLKVYPMIPAILILLVLLIPFSFMQGLKSAEKAAAFGKNGNMASAAKYMNNAMKLDPFKPEYKVDYANYLNYLSSSSKNVTQTEMNYSISQVREAEKMSWYNVDVLNDIAKYYFKVGGDINSGLNVIDRLTALRPLDPGEWQYKADAYLQVAILRAQKGDGQGALNFVNKTLSMIDEAKAVNKRNLEPFIFTDYTQEQIEKAKYIKDNYNRQESIDVNRIIFYSIPEMDINSDGIPDQWNKNKPSEMQIRNDNGVLVLENTKSGSISFIQSRVLSLQPSKTYKIEAELSDSPGANNIPFALTGVSERNDGLKLSDGIYKAEISTAPDFKANNNVLKLGVTGSYKIKSVRVLEK